MLRIYNHYISKIVFYLTFLEILVLFGSVYLGATIRFYGSNFQFANKIENFFLSACVYALVIVFSMSVLGMYQFNYKENLRKTFLRLMPSLALGFCIVTLVFYLDPQLYFGRGIMIIVFIVSALGIFLSRVLVVKSLKLNVLKSRVIFMGGGSLAKECSDLAMKIGYHQYNIVGYIPVQDEECCVPRSALLPAGNSLADAAKKYNASEIVVALQNRRNGCLPIEELLECKLAGVNVIDASSFFEREASQLRVDSLQPSWLVFGGGFDQGHFRANTKRGFDLIASTILLVVSFPVLLITAICIYIEDRYPIFYRQERMGKDGHSFMVLKFRSMRNDAEMADKPQWATTDDPRTTKVGRIIRMLRIDELPQILNVFKGEMSFVGPRPERPYFVKQLCEEIPYYNMRHSIKPGITGLAQVRYKYGASVKDAIQKLQYDLYYVKNNSLFLDILILIDTIQVVLLGKGAR